MRIGYFGDEHDIDKYFKQNFENAKAAGLEIGVYIYTTANSEDDVKANAKWIYVGSIKGATGTSASTVVVGNYADLIPCTSDGKTTAATTITIPFRGYQGTNAKYTKAEITDGTIYNTNGSTAITPTITNATSTAEGKIVYSIPANSPIASAAGTKTGTITVKYTVTDGTTSQGANVLATISQTYTWTKTNAAVNGANAVVVDIYAPQGDIIQNDTNNVILTARVLEAGTDKSSSSTFKWYQYSSSSSATDKYDASTGTGNATASLTVTPAMIDGYGSFKCVATYNNKTYTSYYSVRDKSDPLQVYVYSTVGNQILNSNGIGAVYAVVYQNGVEIDPMPEVVTNTNNVSASALSCYVIDSTNKKLVYKTRPSTSSGTWSNATPSTSCTYNWTFRDKDGKAVTLTNTGDSKTKQAIYIDGSLITKKIVIDVDVTK